MATKDKASDAFTAEEKAAMREHVKAEKAAARKAAKGETDLEPEVLAKIADLPEPDRAILARRDGIVADLRRLVGGQAIIADEVGRRAYETDALTAYRRLPLAVVLPGTTEEVARVLRYCDQWGIKVVARGAGTSLSGGALPTEDAVVIAVSRMNRVLEVDYVNRVARVEVGITNLAISEAVKAAGHIGVVWRGEAQNRNDRFRSLPPELGAELLALPGAVSLDPADSGAADFQATADIIAGLDLVITVDTAVAHLAGAMGRPVWVLLAKHAIDWQWPREGVSPWYPSARLFTQSRAGDWAPVVAAVKAEALRLSPS